MGKKKLWSCLTDDLDHCIECGRSPAQLHHVFYGYSSKDKAHSEEDGFIIPLCYRHHTQGRTAIHCNIGIDVYWKATCQRRYEESHTRDEFRKRYGKSYLLGPRKPR